MPPIGMGLTAAKQPKSAKNTRSGTLRCTVARPCEKPARGGCTLLTSLEECFVKGDFLRSPGVAAGRAARSGQDSLSGRMRGFSSCPEMAVPQSREIESPVALRLSAVSRWG